MTPRQQKDIFHDSLQVLLAVLPKLLERCSNRPLSLSSIWNALPILTERTEGKMLHQWLTSLYSAPYFHVFHSGAGQPRDLPILSSTSFRRQPIWICYVPTHTDKTNVSGHFSFISSSSLISPLSPILPFFLTPCLCFRLSLSLAVSLLS